MNQEDTEARQVQKTASVAPGTVTALSTGAVDMQPTKARRGPQKRSQGLDYHHKALPQVEEAAKQVLADPNWGVPGTRQIPYSHVIFVSKEEVMVR